MWNYTNYTNTDLSEGLVCVVCVCMHVENWEHLNKLD